MEVTYYQFCKTIAEDFNIELTQKNKVKLTQFPIKNGKRKINFSYDGIIVDKDGNEYPYMLTQTIRNEEKLIDFDYIYNTIPKSLAQIVNETGVKLKSKPCKICEGNGWYTHGIKYSYNEIHCEI